MSVYATAPRWPVTFARCTGVLALLVGAACTDVPPTAPAVPTLRTAQASSEAALGPEQALLDSLARGLAAAMQDASVRKQILEDLRDAPFERHTVHFSSYVQGPRGSTIAHAVALRAGLSLGRVTAAGVAGGGLQLRMAGMANRARWAGDADVLVAGTARPTRDMIRANLPATAFRPDGRTVRFALDEDPGTPVFLLQPATVAFGTDPERARAAAPRRARPTISTVDEELATVTYRKGGVLLMPDGGTALGTSDGLAAASTTTMSEGGDCDPTTAVTECPGDGPGSGDPPPPTWDGIQLPSGRGWVDCTRNTPYYDGRPIVDEDRDDWDDGCEYELALAFRPTLAVDAFGDCDLNREPYYSVRGYAPGNGFWDNETQIIRGHSNSPMIFYAIGWDRDCGTAGFTAHIGDSEFVILKLAWAADPAAREDVRRGKWFVFRMFLSAHWNTDDPASSGDYHGSDLEYRTDYRGRPRVWVARGKHANYRSRGACAWGGWSGTDDCTDNSDNGGSLEIVPDGNLGQLDYPLRGDANRPVQSRRYAAGQTKYGNAEYFWTRTKKFSGWLSPYNHEGSTPYVVSLEFFGF